MLLFVEAAFAATEGFQSQRRVLDQDKENILSHSCIHDQIIEQRKRPGRKVYSVSAQVYLEPDISKTLKRRGRALLGVSELPKGQTDAKKPIRIYLNYDAVGHSSDRDCRNVGDIVKASIFENNRKEYFLTPERFCLSSKFSLGTNGGSCFPFLLCFLLQLGEPAGASFSGAPSCNPQADPPIYGDCWYNCTLDDIAEEDKKLRLRKVLFYLFFVIHLYGGICNIARISRMEKCRLFKNFVLALFRSSAS